MKNLLDNIHFYIFGVFTGVVVSGVIYLFVTQSGLMYWIYQHESLAGSLIAASAAAATVIYLHLQIRQNGMHEKQRRRDRLDAERSVLPHALATIQEHVDTSLSQCKRMARLEIFDPSLPHIPFEAIATVKACIEFAPERPREKMMSLLGELQVQRSRQIEEVTEYDPSHYTIASFNDTQGKRLSTDFSSAYCNVSALLIIQELWAFARNDDSDEVESKRSERVARLFIREGFQEDWQDFIGHVERTIDNN